MGDGLTIDGIDCGEYGLKPPLVSVVILSWNYEDYVGAAIDSIRRQDYPHFECLVVDNASTDNSREVIARHIAGDPRFSTVFLARNHGQMGGWLEVLDRLNGEFVTFLDADDIKFPNFISAHVQVHLSLRLGIGFTSSRMVEFDAGDRVTSGANLGFGFIPFDQEPRGLKPRDAVPRLATIGDEDYELLSQATYRIAPEKNGWYWSPTSANMYRREVMKLVRPERDPDTDMCVADIHFCVLCHIVGGSAVIDRTLSAYRIHARHGDTSRQPFVSMMHMRTEPEAGGPRHRRARLLILRTLLQRADRLRWVIKDRYWQSVDQQSGEFAKDLPAYYANADVQEVFGECFAGLVRDFGEDVALEEIGARFPTVDSRLPILRHLLAQSPAITHAVSAEDFWRWVDWCQMAEADEPERFADPRVVALVTENLCALAQAFGSAQMLTVLRSRCDEETRRTIIKESRCKPVLAVAALQNAIALLFRWRDALRATR